MQNFGETLAIMKLKRQLDSAYGGEGGIYKPVWSRVA
jgi:hypothetical protein